MAERITVQGDEAGLTNGDGSRCVATIEAWMRQILGSIVQGMSAEPLPDNVKWLVTCGALTICIVELKPEVRRILWIDEENSPIPIGPESVVRPRRLATPYVVLKVPFRRGRVLSRVEVFYRREPLRSLDGDGGALYWTNLLNVSPHSYDCIAWFCTQYLGREVRGRGLAGGLNAVVNHLWGGSFNRSSEQHEGASAFSKAIKDGVDSRVTDVNRWEAESEKDPRFVLDVDWRSADVTVRELIMRELKKHNSPTGKLNTAALANHLVRAAIPRRRGK